MVQTDEERKQKDREYYQNHKEDYKRRGKEWNKKNPNPLGESYVIGQLSWHRRQKESILPPNCSNKAYYQDLRIKCGGNTCTKFKNPVRLAQWKHKIAEDQAKKKSKKVKKKVTKKKKVSNNQ